MITKFLHQLHEELTILHPAMCDNLIVRVDVSNETDADEVELAIVLGDNYFRFWVNDNDFDDIDFAKKYVIDNIHIALSHSPHH